jgi:hypothetical protein
MAPSIRRKLAITWPTSGGRSVGIVHSRTQTIEFFFYRSITTAQLAMSFPIDWLDNSFKPFIWNCFLLHNLFRLVYGVLLLIVVHFFYQFAIILFSQGALLFLNLLIIPLISPYVVRGGEGLLLYQFLSNLNVDPNILMILHNLAVPKK